MVYRQHVYETEGVFSALIRVQTRADGLLWGALAAVVLPCAPSCSGTPASRWSRRRSCSSR